MFSLFESKAWTEESIPELTGSHGGLTVTLRNLPCKRHVKNGRVKYVMSDYGFEFMEALKSKLIESGQVMKSQLSTGAPEIYHLQVRDYPLTSIEIRGNVGSDEVQFWSDLADAIIAAFESQNRRP